MSQQINFHPLPMISSLISLNFNFCWWFINSKKCHQHRKNCNEVCKVWHFRVLVGSGFQTSEFLDSCILCLMGIFHHSIYRYNHLSGHWKFCSLEGPCRSLWVGAELHNPNRCSEVQGLLYGESQRGGGGLNVTNPHPHSEVRDCCTVSHRGGDWTSPTPTHTQRSGIVVRWVTGEGGAGDWTSRHPNHTQRSGTGVWWVTEEGGTEHHDT